MKTYCALFGAVSLAVASHAFMVGSPLTGVSKAPASSSTVRMAVALPPLPFEDTALEPLISKRTLDIHHGKHHAKYVTVTNEMIKGTDLENASLEEIVKAAKGKNQGLFNNAAQVWNHNFYWNCIKANGGGKPTGKVAALIDRDLGGFEAFRKQFAADSNGNFGSGWTWLAMDGDKLKIVKTSNADLPLTQGMTPLLVIDVWEHAYYLDVQNVRAQYVDNFLDKLVNWDFVNANLA
ncbi:hypothetical protein NSK_003863 [Nannochloropsis salina CCMP1776]|uniref:Superoxide dismutase n=1 Tax=Nannochloropsis salina CCMP1776 TaxID=1027361 RepID=A0A4D9CZL6_9STRA|nr:hypothetical protein NSK_003863 [Nannochloropsis salina CCMP1776]|eukprot:TFJ84831.1 hypothetical protein NSK_003863 [Nannochloropsis salina CCMP1776]